MSTVSNPALDSRPHAAMNPSGSTAFTWFLAAETRDYLSLRHALLIVLFALFTALVAFWMPTFPEPVFNFFERVMQIEGWGDIILVNVFTGLFFVPYWFGVFEALRVYVVPQEEGYLTLLLSKPIGRSSYLIARLLPIFVVLLVASLAAGAAGLGAMAAMGIEADYWAMAVACLLTISLALAVLAVVNYFFLAARDTYTAIGIAFLPMFVFFVPSGFFLYRPDLYEASPLAKNLLVFPANFLWNEAFIGAWGLAIAAGFLGLSVLLVGLTGYRLSRRDIQ